MRARTLAAVLVAAAACAIAPAALAASSTHTIAPVFGSWYQPDPTCDLLGACIASTELPIAPPVDIPTSRYPEGTLHVSWAGAAETARSYITFDVFSVFGDFETAFLDVPLDVDPANGNTLPDVSAVVACITTDILENSSGSFAPPPTVDCTDGVLLTYVAEPTPHLTGDLGPLIDDLRAATAIALLPDAEASGAEAWHVTFSSHRREGSDIPAPTLTVTVTDPDDDPLPAPPSPAPEPPAVVEEVTRGTTTPDLRPVAGVTQPVTGQEAPPVPEVAAPAEPSGDVPGPVSQPVAFDETPKSYPQVYLLPLALLLVVPFVGRSLTADLRTGT